MVKHCGNTHIQMVNHMGSGMLQIDLRLRSNGEDESLFRVQRCAYVNELLPSHMYMVFKISQCRGY